MLDQLAAMNTTTLYYSDMSGMGRLVGPLFAILVIVGGLAVVYYTLSSLQRYKAVWRLASRAARVVGYAVVGTVSLAALYAVYLCSSVAGSAAADYDPKLIGYGVGYFIVAAIAGYLTITAIRRLFSYIRIVSAEKEIINPLPESMGSAPGGGQL